MIRFSGLILIASFFSLAMASDAVIKPLRVETPPVIDGKLDEAFWKRAPSMGDFKNFTPDWGSPISEETVAYMAYDARNIYFAFRCYDREPDKVKASMVNRDNINADDWICINLDSFNDSQSLYGIYVNPFGIQGDTRFANNSEDSGFDMVFYSGGHVDQKGYTIEVAIPLKSLRFTGRDLVEMGVIFERRIARTSEQGTSPALDASQGASFLTQMQTLHYEQVQPERVLEVLPAVTYHNQRSRQGDSLEEVAEDEDLSITAKYGLTSSLILDATYNPDFNQVEADAGQVDINLRSPLFFAEKRPFFLEGRENFTVAATGRSNPLSSVVHTRNIIDPIYGIKLNGKVGKRGTLSALSARDEYNENNPTNFGILRYKHRTRSDGFIGGIFTSRSNDVRDSQLLGFDGVTRLNENTTLNYNVMGSKSDFIFGDSDENGHAVSGSYIQSTRDRDINFSLTDISEDFRAASGYMSRRGISRIQGQYRRKWYPKNEKIQRISADFFTQQTEDKFSDEWETYNRVAIFFNFLRTQSANARYIHATEIFNGVELDTGGYALYYQNRPTNAWRFSIYANRFDAIFYSNDPFQGYRRTLNPTINWQPSDKLNADLSYYYQDFYKKDTDEKLYQYTLSRLRVTYQANRYLFFRGIVEHNGFHDELLTDFLASFTYIPGTVVHLGYGSLYDEREWNGNRYVTSDGFNERDRGFFFKASYLWRK